MTSSDEIRHVCNDLADMLIAKNIAYGDSALNPLRIFSKANTVEQINVRIDDKLSRIARGHACGEDVEWDLLGYLILKEVHRRRHAQDVFLVEDSECQVTNLSDN
jgi:hypothetical protein